MSISKREKTLILAVVLLALLGAYYLYYLKPCLDELGVLDEQIISTRVEITVNEQKQAQLGTLEKQIAELDEQLAAYSESSAQAFDQPPILVYLSKTIGDSAHKGSIYFEQPAQIAQIQRCSITVTALSTYDGLKTLLNDLARAPYLLRVATLSVDLPSGETVEQDTAPGDEAPEPGDAVQPPAPSNRLEIQLTLDFYCLPGEVPADGLYEFDTARQYGGDIFY